MPSSIGMVSDMSPVVFNVNILDPETYAAYRVRIGPILERYGATVRAEFEVASTINSSTAEDKVNRLIVFILPSHDARDRFFTDGQYLAVKPLLLSSTENINRLVWL